MVVYIRHEGGSERLEEESNKGSHGREVATKTAAESQDTSSQGNGCEDQGDEEKGKHEAREVVVGVGANELLGNAVGGAKVAGRVKGQGGDNGAAVCIMAVGGVNAADGEVGPSRGIASVGNAVGRGLEEVEQVDGGAVDGAAQDDEELEDDAASEEDQRCEGEDGACEGVSVSAEDAKGVEEEEEDEGTYEQGRP